jgi:hypothetical protein
MVNMSPEERDVLPHNYLALTACESGSAVRCTVVTRVLRGFGRVHINNSFETIGYRYRSDLGVHFDVLSSCFGLPPTGGYQSTIRRIVGATPALANGPAARAAVWIVPAREFVR